MINLAASIIPGHSAANVLLGSDIEAVLVQAKIEFTRKQINPNTVLYCSESVDMWATDGKINQIGLHGQYQGRLMSNIGIGTPMAIVEKELGKVTLDIEDNLRIGDISGVCIEVDPDHNDNPVTDIFVFSEEVIERSL